MMADTTNKVVELWRMCWRYDVTTVAGRRAQSVKMIGVALIAIIGLLIFVTEDVYEANENIQQANILEENLSSSLLMASLIHHLQIERGLTVLCLQSTNKERAFQILNSAREKTDKVLKKTNWPFDETSEREFLRKPERFEAHINKNRYHVRKCEHGTLDEQIIFYTLPIKVMLEWFYQTVRDQSRSIILLKLIGYYYFLSGKDKIGIERALGGAFFAKGHFNSSSQQLWFANHTILGQDYLESSGNLLPEIDTKLKKINDTNLRLVEERRNIILANKPGNASLLKGEQWFNLMTLYLNELVKIQEDVGESLKEGLAVEKERNNSNLTKRLSFLVFSILLVPLLVYAVYRMTGSIQNYTLQLAQKTLQLKEEKHRADNLLYQIFPHPVAEKLKNNQQIPAEYFNSVTIFFSDIVNFTEMCSSTAPLQVTAMLDAVYGLFDDRIDRYEVYKVETIGDAYMVVSGLPQKNGIRHADQIARMALDLVRVVDELNVPEARGQLSVRIGLHTGPCVAGVVGNKMPRYCLFGDTVNTASRMQTSGEPQKIHISGNTKQTLDEISGYNTVYRGNVELKGKGHMSTYWLEGFSDALQTFGPGEVSVSAYMQL